MKGIKGTVKTVLGRMVMWTGLYRTLMAERGLIVAWHRIDDRYAGNPISYSVDGFERFCRFFRRHFDVVTLSDFLACLEGGDPVRGKVAITFDDGYLDNFTTAAPILVDHGLPATFFIATGFIGTDRIPWWDRDAGIRSEWMTWDQVRQLSDMGFSVGAHTVNHVDLGEVHGAEAREEIEGSRRRLEKEVGHPIDLFAFPYGREHQLSEENRELVKALGLRCAPSCCGGLVPPEADPFRLAREPISPWFAGPGQFALEIIRR